MPQFLEYEGKAWKLSEEQKEFFASLEGELGTSITVIHGGGRRRERPEGVEGVVIFDYSTNSETPNPRQIDYISRKNSTTVKLKNCYLLKPDDREHIFDFNGFPLCEMKMNTVWALLPLDNFETQVLMKEFFGDAIRKSTDEKFFRAKEEEKQNKIKEAFLKAMKASNEGEIEAQKSEIDKQSNQLAALNQQLVATHTILMRAEQRMQIAQKLSEGDEAVYDQEITSLLRHSQIKRIDFDVSKGFLEIYTRLLYIYSPSRSERAELGEFLIKVNTRASNAITLHNLTNQRSHKMHPHVEANGSACWGAIGTQIAKLAASCRIEGLADLVIRYLETYNVQDGNAQYAKYWFTAKDTQRRREEFDNQWMTESELATARAQKTEKPKKEIKEDKNKTKVEVPKDIEFVTDQQLEELPK